MSNYERMLRVIRAELDDMGIGDNERDVNGADAVDYLNSLLVRLTDVLNA